MAYITYVYYVLVFFILKNQDNNKKKLAERSSSLQWVFPYLIDFAFLIVENGYIHNLMENPCLLLIYII